MKKVLTRAEEIEARATFSEDATLNKDALDDCAIEQAYLYGEWSKQWAKAKLELDIAETMLKRKKGEIDEKIRVNPYKFGWESKTGKDPTETFIDRKVEMNEEVMALEDDILVATYNCNILDIAKNTLDRRGRSLDVLAKLYSSNYFSAKPPQNYNTEETFQKNMNRSLETSEGMMRRKKLGD